MKLLGRGYYYNVYDIGNDRVRKVEKDPVEKAIYIFFSLWGNIPEFFRTMKKLERNRNATPSLYAELLKKADPALLGNPIFLSGIDYEQDKVRILGPLLKTENAEAIIDAYIDNIITCWKYGFADTVFNFTLNNGLAKDETAILADFNEITFDKEEVRKRIKNKRWLSKYSYMTLSSEHKAYYRAQMDARITEAALEEHWNKK
jgi:hypothetical protein